MNKTKEEQELHDIEIGTMIGRFFHLKEKVEITEAILDSKHGQDIDALELAEDILTYFYAHGHALMLHHQPPAAEAEASLDREPGRAPGHR
jgi:hypothetical protein